MTLPALSRFDRTFLKAKSPTDNARVPYAGAQVDFYRTGATVRTTTSVIAPGSTAAVEVFGIGSVAAGNTVQAGLAGSMPLAVVAVDAVLRQVSLRNDTGQGLSIPAGTRLVLLSARPKVYGDPFGESDLGPTIMADAIGRAQGYLAERRVDFTVGAQADARLHIDAEGPLFDGTVVLNALDYFSLQVCVDSVPLAGGIVVLPPGGYAKGTFPKFDAPLILPSDRPIHLIGGGSGITRLTTALETHNQPVLRIHGNNKTVRGIAFERGSGGPAPGDGIVVGGDFGTGGVVENISIIDCTFRYQHRWRIYFDDASNTRYFRHILLEGLNTPQDNATIGNIRIAGNQSRDIHIRNCRMAYFDTYGIWADGVQHLSLIDCIIENGATSAGPYLYLTDCSNVLVDHCWFEGGGTSASRYYIELESLQNPVAPFGGILIENCLLSRHGGEPRYPRAIKVGAGAKNVSIRNPYLSTDGSAIAESHILIEPGAEAVIMGGNTVGPAGPSITDSDGNATVWASARRLRLPRRTTAQRDQLASPALGDMIFNVDSGVRRIQVFTNQGWKNLG